MEVSNTATDPSWAEPAYGDPAALPLDLPPELLLLATMSRGAHAQMDNAKVNVAEAHQRLAALREEIAQAIERAREAQEDAGFWGDVSSVLGDDVAMAAAVVASAAAVAGTGGTATAVVVAMVAVGFTASGEIAEECGLDPRIVLALKVAGAAAGLATGNAAGASQFWSSLATGAQVTEGVAVAGAGGAHIVEGQYQGDATEARGEAAFLRRTEQLESQLTDEQIAQIEKLVERVRFLTEAAGSINANNHALEQSVIRRIGG